MPASPEPTTARAVRRTASGPGPARHEDRDRRRGHLRDGRRAPAPRRARDHRSTRPAAYAGGHTNTIRVDTPLGSHHVDTGFIVMNDRNYPNFTRLLEKLGVATQPTHMSFSVKARGRGFRVRGHPARPVLPAAQPHQHALPAHAARPAALQPRPAPAARRGRSQRDARSASSSPTHQFSQGFIDRLIVPQVSAVWSADPRRLRTFPVRFLAEFFANHGMLGFRDRPALVDCPRRLGALCRRADRALPRAHPAERAGAFDHARRRARRARTRAGSSPSAMTTS